MGISDGLWAIFWSGWMSGFSFGVGISIAAILVARYLSPKEPS